MFLGGLLERRVGSKLCVLIGGYILAIGTCCASFCTSLAGFVLTDGILFGAGMGLCYTAPIASSVRWLPHRKGLATGIIVGGFGGGAFLFGMVRKQYELNSGPLLEVKY